MLKRVTIQNFKSLRNVTVDLEPVTVLIGRSGTGKSNFVRALRFLRDYVDSGERAVNELSGWRHVLCATSAGEPLSFVVEFRAPGVSDVVSYELSFRMRDDKKSASFGAESLRIGARHVFAQSDAQWTHAPEVVDAPSPGQVVLKQLYGIPEVRVSHVVLTKGLGCYDFPGSVLSGSAGSKDPAGLNDDGVNYLGALDAINTNLTEFHREKDMRAALQRLNRTVTSVDLTADRAHVRVGHRVGDGKTLTFGLDQESEGFRRFLAHLIALYQQPAKQICIFEEPEKGIYPGALAILAEHFQAVAAAGRSQVILTTHSPELLKCFKPEQIRVVTMDEYETRIGPLAPEQKESLVENLMTADELLTVDEARPDLPSESA